jgi:glycosyltransferase involved in cell wall biosynthesis
LRSFGLTDNVVLIPQGALGPPGVTRDQAREAMRLGQRPTVATFGFLLPHKGTRELVEAVELVREELPDVLLIAPCAIHPDPSSPRYREACEREVTRRGLERNVTLVTDFLKDDEIRTILAAADVIVLPYTETTESSSAALRFVLGIGAPIITTRIPIFGDVTDVVRQTGTAAPEELAEAILDVLRSPELASDLAVKASERADELSWARAAQAHLDAYRSILPRRRPVRR